MEPLVSFISHYGALPFAAALFFYSFIHKDFPLKSACGISSAAYVLCFYLQVRIDEYAAFYPLFLGIDAIWLLVLWRVCRVSLLIVGIFAANMVILSAAPLLFVNHWLFHGLYDYLYVALQLVFVASLTILPQKLPKLFASPYNEKDDDSSFIQFIKSVTPKDFRNFIASRGIL